MPRRVDRGLLDDVRALAHPVTGNAQDYDPLLELIGDARFVLLGGASYGTFEFFRERAEITKRLITEKGFTAVAIEADWPDAYRVNRYVRGVSNDTRAVDALADFRRFPTWMWRNSCVAEFVQWLREHNETAIAKTGFYGLDLYSLRASMDVVHQYLEKTDPEAARQVLKRYASFDHVGEDTQVYGFVKGTSLAKSREDEVIGQLVELERRAVEFARSDVVEEESFFADLATRSVRDVELYYRLLLLEDVSTWNLRDRHMAETLSALAEHLGKPNGPAKIAVWAHNSHVGDARATEMGLRGELNIGQIARLWHGYDAVLIGFTTHHGYVTTASSCGGSVEHKLVRPVPAGGYEELLHRAELDHFLLTWQPGQRGTEGLNEPRLERAIGVIYRPETERRSHNFEARLPMQFDAVLHFDGTDAIKPLEVTVTTAGGVNAV